MVIIASVKQVEMKRILLPILVIGVPLLSACGALTTEPEAETPPQELKLPFADMEIIENKVIWKGEENWEDKAPFPYLPVELVFMPSGRRVSLTYAQYLELDIENNPPDFFNQMVELGIFKEGAKFIYGITETEWWGYISSFDIKCVEWFESFEDRYPKLPDGTHMRGEFLFALQVHYPELHKVLTESGKEALRLQLNEALEAMEPYKTNEIPPFKYAVSEAKLAGVDDKHLTLLFGEEVVSDGH